MYLPTYCTAIHIVGRYVGILFIFVCKFKYVYGLCKYHYSTHLDEYITCISPWRGGDKNVLQRMMDMGTDTIQKDIGEGKKRVNSFLKICSILHIIILLNYVNGVL